MIYTDIQIGDKAMEKLSEELAGNILEEIEERVLKQIKAYNNINTIVAWNKKRGLVAAYGGYDSKCRQNYYIVKLYTLYMTTTKKVYESEKGLIDKTVKFIIED